MDAPREKTARRPAWSMNAPTKKAARRPARTIAPHVWLFYAIEGQAATRWADDIRPGEIFFWRHDSLAYTKQLKVGDNVVVMIGTPGCERAQSRRSHHCDRGSRRRCDGKVHRH